MPVDTGRKLNVHKTFRRRPGCLLNVLCTFNLGPVSTGLYQFSLRKIKSKLSVNEYKPLYPTGFSQGKIHGTAKIHKLSDGDGID